MAMTTVGDELRTLSWSMAFVGDSDSIATQLEGRWLAFDAQPVIVSDDSPFDYSAQSQSPHFDEASSSQTTSCDAANLANKSNLSRSRWALTESQQTSLEAMFAKTQSPPKEQRLELSLSTGLSDERIKNWFKRTATESRGQVRCKCGRHDDTTRFVIKCLGCQTFQHALCLGIYDCRAAPQSYRCWLCANPQGPNSQAPEGTKRKRTNEVTRNEDEDSDADDEGTTKPAKRRRTTSTSTTAAKRALRSTKEANRPVESNQKRKGTTTTKKTSRHEDSSSPSSSSESSSSSSESSSDSEGVSGSSSSKSAPRRALRLRRLYAKEE